MRSLIKALVLGLGLYLSRPALTWALTIDDFLEYGLLQVQNGEVKSLLIASPSAIGQSRSLKVQGLEGGGQVTLKTLDGYLNHSQDAGTKGQSWIVWDGDANPDSLNPIGLGGVDLTQDSGTALVLKGVSFDYPFSNPLDLMLVVYDASDPGGLKSSSATITLSQAIQNQDIVIPFANFTSHGWGGAASFQNVGAIQLWIKGHHSDVDLRMAAVATNGICPQVPDQTGRVIDICGVCGGDGRSCLDCKGVPFGNAVPDECGVCDGDGSTCPKCWQTDISSELESLLSKARAQRALNLKLTRKICPAKAVLARKLKTETQSFYSQMVKLIQSLPTTMLRCINSPECIQVQDYAATIEEYNTYAEKLYQVMREIIHERRNCLKGGVCKDSPGACAERARKRKQEEQNLKRNGRRLMEENTSLSNRVPCVTNICR